MKGTAEKPIILTGKEQIKGFWRGIYTESSYLDNIMNYATIDYAGGDHLVVIKKLVWESLKKVAI